MDYTPSFDPSTLKRGDRDCIIHFQTTRVRLGRNEDDTFHFGWGDRLDRPHDHVDGSANAAQLEALAGALGYSVGNLQEAELFHQYLKRLTAGEVQACLETVADWHVNAVSLSPALAQEEDTPPAPSRA